MRSLRQRKPPYRLRRYAEPQWHPTASHGARTKRRQAPSGSRVSARENRLVYVILAEDCLVLAEAQAPQPDQMSMKGPQLRVAAHHRAVWGSGQEVRKRSQ